MANKEKVSQKVQEAIFAQLLTNPINNECADCHTSSPNWVSLDFGVFICMRCSGVHRQLGPHISRVRSLKLDGWTKDNIEIMATVGNKIANDYYEHKMPTGYRRPGANSSADECRRFIDDKYINKRFIPPGFSEPVKDFVACREKGTKPDFSYSQQKQNKPQQQAPQPVTEPKKQPQPAFGFIRKKSTSLDPVEHHHHDKKTNHQAHHHPDLLSADVDLLGNYSESNDSNSQGIHSASPPAKKINFANFKKAQSQPATVPLHHHQSQPDLTTTFPWGQEAQQTANNNNNNAQPQPQENKVDLMKLYTQPQGHQNHFMQGMNPGWQQYGQWNGGMNQGYNNGYMGHQNNFQAGYQQQQNFGAQQGFQGGQNMGYNPYVNHGNQQGHVQNQFGNNGFVQAQGQNNYF